MPGLYVRDTGGVSRKCRELHEAQGGVDRKLREMYARDGGGVSRRVFGGLPDYTFSINTGNNKYGSENATYAWTYRDGERVLKIKFNTINNPCTLQYTFARNVETTAYIHYGYYTDEEAYDYGEIKLEIQNNWGVFASTSNNIGPSMGYGGEHDLTQTPFSYLYFAFSITGTAAIYVYFPTFSADFGTYRLTDIGPVEI